MSVECQRRLAFSYGDWLLRRQRHLSLRARKPTHKTQPIGHWMVDSQRVQPIGTAPEHICRIGQDYRDRLADDFARGIADASSNDARLPAAGVT